jgi:hypothetical protein
MFSLGLQQFLGAFANYLKATASFVISVSVRQFWNNSAANGRIFMKFGIQVIFRKSVEKITVSSKFDKNNGYFI